MKKKKVEEKKQKREEAVKEQVTLKFYDNLD